LDQDRTDKDDEQAQGSAGCPFEEVTHGVAHNDETLSKSLPKYRLQIPMLVGFLVQDEPIGASQALDQELKCRVRWF
jgi:hypothetical protein